MYFALHCITLLPRVSQLITTPHYIQSRDTIHSPRTPHIPPKILGKLIYIHILEVLEAFPSFYFHKDFIRTRTKSSIPSVNLHLSIWLCSASMIRSACCGKPTNAQHILQLLNTAHCILYSVQWTLYSVQWTMYISHCNLHIIHHTTAQCTQSSLHSTHFSNCTTAQLHTILAELCISYLNCAFPTRATVHFLPVRGQCILGPEANQLGVHGGNNALKKRHSNDLVECKQ